MSNVNPSAVGKLSERHGKWKKAGFVILNRKPVFRFRVNLLLLRSGIRNMDMSLSDGVTVALQILVLPVQVRILVGQRRR